MFTDTLPSRIEDQLYAPCDAPIFVTLIGPDGVLGCKGAFRPGWSLHELIETALETIVREDSRYQPCQDAKVVVSTLHSFRKEPPETIDLAHGVLVALNGRRAFVLPEAFDRHGITNRQDALDYALAKACIPASEKDWSVFSFATKELVIEDRDAVCLFSHLLESH